MAGAVRWVSVLLMGTQPPRRSASGTNRWLDVRFLILAAWAYSVVPNMLDLLSRGRVASVVSVASSTEMTPLARLSLRFLWALFVAIAGLIIVRNAMRRSATGLGTLGAFLAPWAALQISALLHGQTPGRPVIAFLAFAVALWLAAPPLAVLSTLGWATVMTAVSSLAFGLLDPTLALLSPGIYNNQSIADKSIVGNSLLAGPFSHSNTFGMALAFGLPAVFLIGRRSARWIGIAVVLVALAWTASRTSIAAVALAALTCLLIKRMRPGHRPIFGVTVILGAVAFVAWTPFNNLTPSAYSDRGRIWMTAIRDWQGSPWTGAGPSYFKVAAQYDTGLGIYAFHGHNIVVHILATGGLLGAVGLATFVLAGSVRALRGTLSGSFLPVAFLITYVAVGWLEVVSDFGDITQLGYAVWPALAAIFFSVGSDDGAPRLADPEDRDISSIGVADEHRPIDLYRAISRT